jgi:putative tricarboxylic transport membrane protein
MLHVPYKSSPPALQDVLAGRVSMMFTDLTTGLPHVRSGALRALAVTRLQRSPLFPELPTLDEAGVTGYEANTWQLMAGPANMPVPIVTKLNAALADFMLTPEAQTHFKSLGMQPMTSTPGEAHEYIVKEAARWTEVIKGMGISVE